LLHIKPKLDLKIQDKPKLKSIDEITLQNLNFTYPKFYEEEKTYFAKMRQRVGGATKLDDPIKKPIKQTKKGLLGSFQKFYNWLQNKISHQSLSVWRRKNLLKEMGELEKMFAKTEANKVVLEDISYTFKKGFIYGIVGYNGAGKSTLTKLLKRTIDPSEGNILINQKNLKTIDPIYWKNYLASLEQESFLWESLSVKENLLLGLNSKEASKIKDKDLWKALELVDLKDSVNSLDAIIGENQEFSGGQAQLLEIARLYLQQKPIMILDEGTNQLDAVKEQKILNILHEIKQNSIVLFITHRMTTTQKCDEILILDQGKIVASGKPQELLKAKTPNLFQEFWNIQVENKN
jgi:ABC-type multidrug transport system fused ATPase/permease subunit